MSSYSEQKAIIPVINHVILDKKDLQVHFTGIINSLISNPSETVILISKEYVPGR